MTTITRERLLKIQQWRETYGPGSNVVLPAEEAEELARIALASLTAEPVAWMVRDIDTGEKVIRPDRSYFEGSCQPLYTAPPVPVTIDERAEFNAWNNEDNLPIAGVGAKNAAWLAWQARAKLGIPTAPEVPATLPCSVELKPGLIIGKGCKTETLLTALQRRADYYAEIDAMTPEERAEHDANIEAFKAMLPQPTPVVPEEATPKNIEMLASARVRNVTFQWDEDERNAAADSWNACRAAVLNGGKS